MSLRTLNALLQLLIEFDCAEKRGAEAGQHLDRVLDEVYTLIHTRQKQESGTAR